MIPPARLATRLAAVLGLCTALAACGPAYRDYGGGGYGPSYGSYYDPSYAPSYSRSYSTPYYSAPSYSAPSYYAPRYEPRYEPRRERRASWCNRDGGPCDRDDNPPGPRGGPGTNWENPPGPAGGPGASPNRRSSRDRDGDGRPDWWRR